MKLYLVNIPVDYILYHISIILFFFFRHLHQTPVSHHHLYLLTIRDITTMVTTMVRVMTTAINSLLAIEV